MMKNFLRVTPIVSIASYVEDGEVVAFNVGLDGLVYLVVALNPLDYRNGNFAKTVSDRPQTYRVFALRGDQPVFDLVIEGEPFNIHDVQPLGKDLLLVCSRSYYRSQDDFDKNGRVYARDGTFIREILLGDGIGRVQTTSDGVIWTGYFDEGVFGNYGWKSPVGASGLIAWDSAGNKLYDFKPPGPGLDICDCYALNVATERDVWCYYYTAFPLVHLHDRKAESFWRIPLGGSHAFAISGRHALFRGGYKDRDTYQLFLLGKNGNAELIAKMGLRNNDGNEPIANWVVARADNIHFVSNGFLYRIDVQTAINAVE